MHKAILYTLLALFCMSTATAAVAPIACAHKSSDFYENMQEPCYNGEDNMQAEASHCSDSCLCIHGPLSSLLYVKMSDDYMYTYMRSDLLFSYDRVDLSSNYSPLIRPPKSIS